MIRITRPECPNPTALQTNYKHPLNKKALIDASYGKCMYCESKVEAISYGDVEHIKPKAVYPELEYVWDNLGYVCTLCNNAKSDTYYEDCPFVNPYNEDPKDFLLPFGSLVISKRGSERGESTILKVDLNRTPLLEARTEKFNKVNSAIQACFRTQNPELRTILLNALVAEGGYGREFSMMINQLLIQQEVVS